MKPQSQRACLPRRLTRRVAHFFRVGSHARLLLLAFAVIFFHLWTSIFQTMVFILPNFNDVLAFSLFESSFSTLLTGCYMVYTGTQHRVRQGTSEKGNSTSTSLQEGCTERPTCGAEESNNNKMMNAVDGVRTDEPACVTSYEASDGSAAHLTCVPLDDIAQEKNKAKEHNVNAAQDTPWIYRDMPLFHRSRVSLRMYFVIALLMSASLFLTNEASYILSFPVQVTLKSTKLLFTAVAHRCFLSDVDNTNKNNSVGDALAGVSYHTASNKHHTAAGTQKNNKKKRKKKCSSSSNEGGGQEDKDDDEDARSGRSSEEATNTVIEMAEDGVGMRCAVQRTKAGHARRAQCVNHPSMVTVQAAKGGWSWRAKAAHAVRHGSRLRHWLRQACLYLAKGVSSLRKSGSGSSTTRTYTAHAASAVSMNGSFAHTTHHGISTTTTTSATSHTGHHRSSSYSYDTLDSSAAAMFGESAAHTGPSSRRESKRSRFISLFSRLLHGLYKMTCRLVQICTRDAEIASCTLIVVGVILFMYAEQSERGSNGEHRVGALDLSDGIRPNPLRDTAGITVLATRGAGEGGGRVNGGAHNDTRNTSTRKSASRANGLAHNETNNSSTTSSTSRMYNESLLTQLATPFTGRHNRSTLREAVEMDGDITALRAAKAAAEAAAAAAAAAATNTHRASNRTAQQPHDLHHRTNTEGTSSQAAHKNTTHTRIATGSTNTSLPVNTDTPAATPELPEWDEGPSMPHGLLPLNTFLAVMCVLFSNVLDAGMYILEEKYCVPRGEDDEENKKEEKTKMEKAAEEVRSTSTNSATSRKNGEQTEVEQGSATQYTQAGAPASKTKDTTRSITSFTHTPSPPRRSPSALPYPRPARASFEELLFFVNLFTALVYCVAWPLAWSPSLSPRQLSLYLTAWPDNLYYSNINITTSTHNASLLHDVFYGGSRGGNATDEGMYYTLAARQAVSESTVTRTATSDATAPRTVRILAQQQQQQQQRIVIDKLNRTAYSRDHMRCEKGKGGNAACKPSNTPLPRPTSTTTATTTTAAPRRKRRRLRRRRVTKTTQADTTRTQEKNKKSNKKKNNNNNNNGPDEANALPAQGRVYRANITAALHHRPYTLQHINALHDNESTDYEDDQWEFYEDDEFTGYSKVFLLCFLSASCGLAGTTMLLWIIAEHSSTTAVLITCVRKTITVICTYFFYDTSFSLLHFVGLVIVMTGVWWYDIVRRTLED